ncbi:MAG: hypothetical protein ACOVR6_08855 [Fimbriimonas sp.]
MIAADDDAISAPETLPTETIITLIVNNTVVTDGADKGINDAIESTISTTINTSVDFISPPFPDAAATVSSVGKTTAVHTCVTTDAASDGADKALNDAIDNFTSMSGTTSVDLFTPPFRDVSTTGFSAKTTTTAVLDNVGASTTDSNSIFSTTNNTHTSTSEMKALQLVSPPCVERTTLNQQTTLGTKSIRTPKRPKVISLDNYAADGLSYKNDIASFSSSTSINQNSTASSTSSMNCDNSLLKKISAVIPYPIKVWRRSPQETPSIVSFLDVVDLTSNPCCGYTYILRMVDPVHRYGHAVVLKSKSNDDVCYSLSRLMNVVRIQPTTVYFSQSMSYLKDVSELYPNTRFECQEHSEAMINEREIFLKQLNKWMTNDKNWVSGVTVMQAVTNTLPITPVKEQPNLE